jgi:sugar-specific transcriptional regulator TrmB
VVTRNKSNDMDNKELKQNVYTALKELGLTELEINLYRMSLVLGPSPISTIAKHLKVSRPNVYKIIQGLEKHGLANFSDLGKYSRRFIVEPPTILLEKLRQKKETINQLDNSLVFAMPDLLAAYHQGETPTKIKVLKGKEQYLKAYYQIIEEAKGEIQYFGSAKDFIAFISIDSEQMWMEKRIKKDLFIKILVLPGEAAEEMKSRDVKEKRETRILKSATPFITSFQLFANKVIIWQPKAPLAVLIEDEYIVEMLRNIFNILWGSSRGY